MRALYQSDQRPVQVNKQTNKPAMHHAPCKWHKNSRPDRGRSSPRCRARRHTQHGKLPHWLLRARARAPRRLERSSRQGKGRIIPDFSRLLHHFFGEADAELFASLGLNCLRVSFNYRHFMDDDSSDVTKEPGFQLLDRIVNICSKYNTYVVLDPHAVPGGQNQD
ncbi:hypothetical protein J3459_014244 [Metarhizium acridum]|uniref:uncharacterized protein n=1 Tax=Metarhizium acridum TaxID=92637 RepID=UPI001C6CB140|nr:hypothetical protein J3459_014244 [Metarhizium acridum]KAG8416265.1 hypothetical protein J3458_006861 [Metarhizium acridum]